MTVVSVEAIKDTGSPQHIKQYITQFTHRVKKLRTRSMGVDHGGTRGTSPPRIWSRGTLMQIVPSDLCHIGTKRSVLWPSKYPKIRFRQGLCPEPRWGSSRRSPRHPSRLERGHPSPYPIPFGTDPPSALATRPPQNSSHI